MLKIQTFLAIIVSSGQVIMADYECANCHGAVLHLLQTLGKGGNLELQIDVMKEYTCAFLDDWDCPQKVDEFWPSIMEVLINPKNAIALCDFLLEDSQCSDWSPSDYVDCEICPASLAQFFSLIGRKRGVGDALLDALHLSCEENEECREFVDVFVPVGLYSLNFAGHTNRKFLCAKIFALEECLQ